MSLQQQPTSESPGGSGTTWTADPIPSSTESIGLILSRELGFLNILLLLVLGAPSENHCSNPCYQINSVCLKQSTR